MSLSMKRGDRSLASVPLLLWHLVSASELFPVEQSEDLSVCRSLLQTHWSWCMHAVTVLIFPLLKSEGKVSMLVQNSSGDGKVIAWNMYYGNLKPWRVNKAGLKRLVISLLEVEHLPRQCRISSQKYYNVLGWVKGLVHSVKLDKSFKER